MDSELLADQIAYYRARAREYDAAIVRVGGYGGQPQGELSAADLERNRQREVMKAALQSVGRVGSALELACGTGSWTYELVRQADRVTAVDAAPEMLALNKTRVDAPNVSYIQADLFAWQPEEHFDLVVFGFWLTHVPPEWFEEFWLLIERCLKPGGQVFFMDKSDTAFRRL